MKIFGEDGLPGAFDCLNQRRWVGGKARPGDSSDAGRSRLMPVRSMHAKSRPMLSPCWPRFTNKTG